MSPFLAQAATPLVRVRAGGLRLAIASLSIVGLGLGCASDADDPQSGEAISQGSGGASTSAGASSASGTAASGGQVAGVGGGVSGGASTGGGIAGGGANTGGASEASGGDSGSGGESDASGGEAGGGGDTGAGGVIDASGGDTGAGGGSAELPKTMIFLLLGQSNMVGAPQPQSEDMAEDPRIQVMAYDNCPGIGRTYNEWYAASPPLHGCDGGVGPGDYFARTLLSKLPDDTTIGLVPLAVNGAPIEVFRKGVPRPGWTLPPDDHWDTGYEWIISRATEAQKFGTISGILFHQGESDETNSEWSSQVAQLVADLRLDLGIGEEAPFIAGEFLVTGCCVDRNELVNQFTTEIPNAWVASSSDLAGTDVYHFDLAGQRELGKRYGQQMISALGL